MKRLALSTVAFGATLLLTAGTAGAFECYNASRSARGNQAAAAAPVLASFGEILADPDVVGLCPDGVASVIEAVEDAGYRTDVLINFRSLMAGGLEKNGKGGDLLHDGKGIDHLGGEFFAFVDPLIGEAFATLCGPPA